MPRLSPIVSPSELAQALSEPGLRLVDCRASLQSPSAGREWYMAGHLPSASFADLLDDLSGKVEPGRTGRHPLPEASTLTARFRKWGIDDTSRVVAYDDSSGAFAARLWWLLRWLGHDSVQVLDGGFSAWVAAGHPVTTELPAPRLGNFVARPRPELVVSAALLSTAESSARRLFDARAPERYRGDVEPIDPVAGHIPGALNLPFSDNLRDGRFRSPAELRSRLDRALAGSAPDDAVIYCGSGVTACHDVLAFDLAGLPLPRLYAGSWSEWITDPTRPVARG